MFSFRSEGVSRSEGIWAGSAHREGEGGIRSEGVSKSEGIWAGSAHSEGGGGVSKSEGIAMGGFSPQ